MRTQRNTYSDRPAPIPLTVSDIIDRWGVGSARVVLETVAELGDFEFIIVFHGIPVLCVLVLEAEID